MTGFSSPDLVSLMRNILLPSTRQHRKGLIPEEQSLETSYRLEDAKLNEQLISIRIDIYITAGVKFFDLT